MSLDNDLERQFGGYKSKKTVSQRVAKTLVDTLDDVLNEGSKNSDSYFSPREELGDDGEVSSSNNDNITNGGNGGAGVNNTGNTGTNGNNSYNSQTNNQDKTTSDEEFVDDRVDSDVYDSETDEVYSFAGWKKFRTYAKDKFGVDVEEVSDTIADSIDEHLSEKKGFGALFKIVDSFFPDYKFGSEVRLAKNTAKLASFYLVTKKIMKKK